MSRGWHVNPETGEPGLCRAAVSCPFGGNDLHFDTENDARKFYEAKMSEYTLAELISKSRKQSAWRSIDWEDRKVLLEEFLSERVSLNWRLRRWPRIRTQWDHLVNGRAEVMGYADEEKRVVHLSEAVEALEESTAKNLVIHELAHFLEPRRAESHGDQWRAKAEELAESASIVSGLSFKSSASYTTLELIRRETHKLLARLPRYVGICERGHVYYAHEIPRRPHDCRKCAEEARSSDDYSLFSSVAWRNFEPSDQDAFVEAQLGRMKFGKDNRP